jgi:hypothetical protein
MTDKPFNPPAFPHVCGTPQDPWASFEYGLSLRDYFAAAALQGLLSNPQISKDMVKGRVQPEENQKWHSDTSYKFADAMLKERDL